MGFPGLVEDNRRSVEAAALDGDERIRATGRNGVWRNRLDHRTGLPQSDHGKNEEI